MSTESAFSTFHVNVDDWPCVMVVGFAVKLMMRGACPCWTVTVTLQVTGPRVLFAVSVYVVVAVGFT
jgi:hypothetical protein